MSDIKVGDWVQQVSVCCDREARRFKSVGVIFQVTGFVNRKPRCSFCGFKCQLPRMILGFPGAPRHAGIYEGWFIKLPPLDEKVSEEEKVPVDARAKP